MTPEKTLEAIETYRRLFAERNVGKINYSHDSLLDGEIHGLEHCHGMLDKMVGFVHDGKMEKAFRWLGFIQGVLWANGIFSLSDLKDHNRTK